VAWVRLTLVDVVCADPVLTGDESISELGGWNGTSWDQDSRYASLGCVVIVVPNRIGRVRPGPESVSMLWERVPSQSGCARKKDSYTAKIFTWGERMRVCVGIA